MLDPAAAKAAFEERGESIRDWATARGFTPALVYAVLSGRIAGRRGASHRIAVALGLKQPPKSKEDSP